MIRNLRKFWGWLLWLRKLQRDWQLLEAAVSDLRRDVHRFEQDAIQRGCAMEVGLSEQRAFLADLQSEINRLRERVAQKAVEPPPPGVRRFPTWRATQAALEGRPLPEQPKPIPIPRG